MSARIVFSGGDNLDVTEDVNDVRAKLTEARQGAGETFAKFQAQGRGVVYVAADQVAYIEVLADRAGRRAT